MSLYHQGGEIIGHFDILYIMMHLRIIISSIYANIYLAFTVSTKANYVPVCSTKILYNILCSYHSLLCSTSFPQKRGDMANHVHEWLVWWFIIIFDESSLYVLPALTPDLTVLTSRINKYRGITNHSPHSHTHSSLLIRIELQ